MTIKPDKLVKGNSIGVITVSNPLSQKHLPIIEGGIDKIKQMGFDVKKGSTIRVHNTIAAGTSQERAEDLMNMVRDKNVKAIFFAWGGENASQILPLLDFKIIEQNPKIFMGHSNPTVIMNAITKETGLITFYGHFASSFDKNWKYFGEYDENMFNKVFVEGKPFILPEANPREVYKAGKCTGELVGGCITDLIKLIGTKFMPDFKSKILILEAYTISARELVSCITHLKQAGVFAQISGLLLGNIMLENPDNKYNLRDIISEELKEYSFPILKTSDFGHDTHMAPMPIGGKVILDVTKKEIRFDDNYVK